VPEPLKLPNRDEVEKHFRAVHKDTIIKPIETHTVGGVLSRNLRSRDLQRLVRVEWERQKYFPLQLATSLSRMFASHGLQFFKVNKTYTHVSVARPLFLDLDTTPVSEGVKRIIAFINTHPKCNRRQLIEALAPTPPPAPIAIRPAGQPVAGSVSSLQAAGAEKPAESDTPKAAAPEPRPPEGGTPNVAPTSAEPTAEQTAVIADLHWLIHQGHVIEFADGRMDTAKKPAPRPPKPEKKPAEEKPAEGDTTTMVVEPGGATPILSEAEIPAEPSPAVEAAASEAATEPQPAEEAGTETPAPTEPAAEATGEAAPPSEPTIPPDPTTPPA